jgi:lipid-A-disaccharide synthase
VQGASAPPKLAMALLPLMSDTPERSRQIEAFARLDAVMEIGSAIPSDRAAAEVLDCIDVLNQPKRETVASATPSA